MTKPGGKSIPLDGKWWFQRMTGEVWTEQRFHRGRVVLRKAGTTTHEVRVYREADDPGTGATILEQMFAPVVEGCTGCPSVPNGQADTDYCPESKRACGHHCDHSWSHDTCCWCGAEWGEGGARTDASA